MALALLIFLCPPSAFSALEFKEVSRLRNSVLEPGGVFLDGQTELPFLAQTGVSGERNCATVQGASFVPTIGFLNCPIYIGYSRSEDFYFPSPVPELKKFFGYFTKKNGLFISNGEKGAKGFPYYDRGGRLLPMACIADDGSKVELMPKVLNTKFSPDKSLVGISVFCREEKMTGFTMRHLANNLFVLSTRNGQVIRQVAAVGNFEWIDNDRIFYSFGGLEGGPSKGNFVPVDAPSLDIGIYDLKRDLKTILISEKLIAGKYWTNFANFSTVKLSREKGFELSGYYETFQEGHQYGSTVGQLFSFDLTTLHQRVSVAEKSSRYLKLFRDYNLKIVTHSRADEVSFCTDSFCFLTNTNPQAPTVTYLDLGKGHRFTGEGFENNLFFDEADFATSGKLRVFDPNQNIWSEIDFSKLHSITGEETRYYYKHLDPQRMLISYGMPKRAESKEGDTVIVDLFKK